MKRGGTLRWVFEVDTPGQAEMVLAMVEPITSEAEVRIAKKLPPKLIVFNQSLYYPTWKREKMEARLILRKPAGAKENSAY